MAAKKSKHKPHGKTQKNGEIPPWEPAADDAINIAGLRLYVLTIEGIALAIYRSDPTPNRPYLKGLQKVLAENIKALRAYAAKVGEETGGLNAVGDKGCPGEDERCKDGLCHPPGDCCD